jgi:predicted nucleic acid-binding protein
MIVVDSNVISELIKLAPAAEVKRWHRFQREIDLYTTAITQAEMLYGAAVLPEGRWKTELTGALRQIFDSVYGGRVLAFDSRAAMHFAELVAGQKSIGRDIKVPDAQIASIVRSHGAVLATRNVRDFQHCGIEVINPFAA